MAASPSAMPPARGTRRARDVANGKDVRMWRRERDRVYRDPAVLGKIGGHHDLW